MDLILENNLINVLNRALSQSPVIKNTKNGRQVIYFSPFVSHRKRKLEINFPSMKWHCWLSNNGGHNIKSLIFKLNTTYDIIQETKELLKGEKHTEYIVSETSKKTLKLPNEFIPLHKKDGSINFKKAIGYCKLRGLTWLDIYKYNIGYCDSGLFKDRIIIPSYDSNQNLNFFLGRSWNDSKYKYMNCDFPKNIIGFDNLINWKYPITLVEGVFDAISTRVNAIPLFGKFLQEKLILKIIESNVSQINVCLDSDALKNNINMCKRFIKFGINVKLINIPKKDPSEMGYKQMTEIINNTPIVDEFDLMKLMIKYN